MHKLFVYGTCRIGGCNHQYLDGRSPLSVSARLEGAHLYDMGPYPALVESDSGVVIGELYEVDDATLRAIDDLEDHPYLYQRREGKVLTSSGHEETAWVYWFRHSVEFGEWILSGDYADRL